MADDDKRKIDVPWTTLLPLLAVLAGVIAQFRPLVSVRPSIPNEKSIEIDAEEDVDARLWQDPLAVVQNAKAQLESDLITRKVPESRVQRHLLSALVNHVTRIAKPSEQVLLFAVMLNSGPYIEQEESRLRARQAVLEGLHASGFVPLDSEHIGYITKPGMLSHVWQDATKEVEDGAVLIPWEECGVIGDDVPTYPANTKHVFVLWLPSSGFEPRPLAAMAELVSPFVTSTRANLKIALLGPANSTGLKHMVEEGKDLAKQPVAAGQYDVLDGVDIVSPLATASDGALLDDQPGDVAKIIASCVAHPARGGLTFRRTILTDDLVLEQLIEELKRRHVFLKPHKERGLTENGDRVVILSEWDTAYGRSLARTFKQKAGPVADQDHLGSRVTAYHYMHGIDGRLPGDQATPADDAQKSSSNQAGNPIEQTEGVNQSDFLRRLASKLRDEDTRYWRAGKGGIKAIGLLGSDIFDKLLILRALRPMFGSAIFFTNNYDAHFERRDAWDDVRNLVVASPFGSTLPEQLAGFQQSVAPFRDNNQTSIFFGTLIATGRLDANALAEELQHQPRLYEVGRRGVQALYDPRWDQAIQPAGGAYNPHWFSKWISTQRVVWHIGIAALALGLMAGWIGLGIVERRSAQNGRFGTRLRRLCSSTAFSLICGVPLAIIGVALFAQSRGIEEPLAFFSGISIWPSEMFRLVAMLLAIHFMLKASRDLRANQREITQRFFPELKLSQKWSWRVGLRHWLSERPGWGTDEARISARDAWEAYLRRNAFWPRFVRVAVLVLIYVAFSYSALTLFPQVTSPARGEGAFLADRIILMLSVLAMMILTFYVVDAIGMNSNFIRILTRVETEWEPRIAEEAGWIPPLSEKNLRRYHDIFFVARRTEAVTPLIWYPVIILAIMFVARSSIFDYWTWPLSLIVVFTLNAGWALGSAMFLRRSAEQLRAAAINALQDERAKNYTDPVKRQTFDELIAGVRAVRKGAFAPLTEQPFIHAIVYPSGGLGLLAVAQRLFDIF